MNAFIVISAATLLTLTFAAPLAANTISPQVFLSIDRELINLARATNNVKKTVSKAHDFDQVSCLDAIFEALNNEENDVAHILDLVILLNEMRDPEDRKIIIAHLVSLFPSAQEKLGLSYEYVNSQAGSCSTSALVYGTTEKAKAIFDRASVAIRNIQAELARGNE